MIHQFLLIGGDRRQSYLAKELKADGQQVFTLGVPELTDSHADFAAAIRAAQAILLPMPVFEKDHIIRSAAHLGITLIDVLQAALPGTYLLGGGLKNTEALIREHGLHPFDYAKSEQLLACNAALTAEGAIQLAMEHTPVAIAGSDILVIGFGRIGKLLAAKLQLLGANVCVCARKDSDLGLCCAMGFSCNKTGIYENGLSHYHCILNTVPAPVLSASQIEQLDPQCSIIDLASVPGGLASDVHPGPNYHHALALPGKIAPASAAKIIKQVIYHTLTI